MLTHGYYEIPDVVVSKRDSPEKLWLMDERLLDMWKDEGRGSTFKK